MTLREVWRLSGMQRMLLLYVVLPLIIIVGAGLAFGLERLNTQESDRLKDDLELIGRAISLPVGEALMVGDEDAVRRTLQSVFAIGRVYGASVFDANGNQVAAAGLAERDLTRSRVAREVVMTGEQQERYRRVSGMELYSYFIPVTDVTGIPNGFIQINRQASDFDASFERLVRTAWLIWGLMSLMTVAIVIFGHYGGIGRHVAQLRETMERVEEGEHQVRSSAEGPSEIASMARGLNRMLDSIDRKNLELAERRAHEQALAEELQSREKMAAIGRVASGIAHELGAPLTVIDGRASRLLKSIDEPQQQRQLEAIRGQVGRLTRIVRQLLNYTRLDVAASPVPVRLSALIDEAITNVSHELGEAQASPQVDAPDDITVPGIESRIELALVNVLRNAFQAARSEVSISLHRHAERVELRIRDDGPGLPKNQSPEQLVEPFVTTKNTGEGTGLGLAIVSQVMSEHGGELVLTNHPDGGCQVSLIFPSVLPPKDQLANPGEIKP
ncbi:MAG: ATP-binding protein [Idiomarina sp.]|nr:ATP-binding protein [Idiomarina sp.]